MVYKSLNSLHETYAVSEVSTRNTRHSDKTRFYLDNTGRRLAIYRDTFIYSAAEKWNNIPANVWQAESLTAFRRKYVKYFFPG